MPGLETVLIISSSSSPTVDKAGRLGRFNVVSMRDRAPPLLLSRLDVTRESVND